MIGRFTQEDTYYEDGLNLYAYCRNNPVNYVDPSGNICDPAAKRICKLIDEGRIKGQNRTKLEQYLKENAGNLNRAEKDIAKKLGVKGNGGAKNGTSTKPNQVYHFATNKSKKYTSQFESIAKKYGLDLDGDWNKQLMPHQGRHPYAYHDYVLDNMRKFDRKANGDKTQFLKLYDQMKQKIINNPEMLYKDYWNK